jgi:hypothetical protein
MVMEAKIDKKTEVKIVTRPPTARQPLKLMPVEYD